MASSTGDQSNNSDKNRKVEKISYQFKYWDGEVYRQDDQLTREEIEKWKKDPYIDQGLQGHPRFQHHYPGIPATKVDNKFDIQDGLQKLTDLFKEDLDEFKSNPFRPSQRGSFSHSSLIPRSREAPAPSEWPDHLRNDLFLKKMFQLQTIVQ